MRSLLRQFFLKQIVFVDMFVYYPGPTAPPSPKIN